MKEALQLLGSSPAAIASLLANIRRISRKFHAVSAIMVKPSWSTARTIPFRLKRSPGGVGGCYGPSDFKRPSKQLQGYAKRHYTRDEIDALGVNSPVDVLLVHDAPAGTQIDKYRRSDWVSEAAGLDRLGYRLRPLVCFFRHHHTRVEVR